MRYLIYSVFFCCMIGCKNHRLSSSFLITAQNNTSTDTNYKVVDVGVVAKDENNITAIQLCANHKFGFTIEANVESNRYYLLHLKVKSKHYSVNLATESPWDGWIGTHNPIPIDGENNWYYLSLLLKIPDTIANGKIKIYTHNWASDTCYVDSLQITQYSDFPFADTLPNFVFNPLTYDILNELAFYTKNITEKNYVNLMDSEILNTVFKKHFISRKLYKNELESRIKKSSIIAVFDAVKKDAAILINPSVNTNSRETYETKLTGYTQNIIYTQGEKIIINLQNASQLKSIQVLKTIDNYKFQKIQDIDVTNKEKFEIATENLLPGTYAIQLKDTKTTFNIPVIINSTYKSSIIILAPITTWHAYNFYNGKCFYVNTKDDSCVYHLSTQRPLVSCLFDSLLVGHDLFIFEGIYKFFYQNYKCNVYPDYYLEAHPKLFIDAKTIVFAQHCEYFSTKMFETLAQFSTTKNIISLGGNQAYYKIQFANNFQTVECRKDGTFLDNTLIPGGNWRTSFSNEAKYWGNAYTDAGYESYCAYSVKESSHWLFKDCNVKDGDLFGKSGIDNRGISGDEMDKVNNNTPQNAIVIAKGINPNDGGGDIVMIENKNNAILSFGSIACGSGLEKDKTITQIVRNFLQKYHF